MTLTVADLDEWRAAYPTATYQEQQAFHSRIWRSYPDQAHYSGDEVAKAIEDIQPATVIELGGWDGELAHAMLDQHPTIRQWTNIEICREAAVAGLGRHSRYRALIRGDWYWATTWQADLFVGSHVIEHLTARDLERVIAATDAPALFFDAPLHDHGGSWQGTMTTHILNAGWDDVTALCASHGYHLAWAHDHATSPQSGDHARACLYQRQV